MGKATVINVDGSVQELDHRPTLKEAQEIVGGYIEFIRVPPNLTLIVNEDGTMKGLKVNPKASLHFRPYNLLGNIIVLEGWRTVGKDN